MNCVSDTIADIDLQRVLACLGYSRTTRPDGAVRDQVEGIVGRAAGAFRGCFKKVAVTGSKAGLIDTIYGPIESRKFGVIAGGADTLYVCLVTSETNEEENHGEPCDLLSTLIHDAIGTVVVEQGVDYLMNAIQKKTGRYLSLPFSPGYCDLSLEGQRLIFSALGQNPLGVVYDKESWMMTPIKSVSFIVSVRDTPMARNPCNFCSLTRCFMRRSEG